LYDGAGFFSKNKWRIQVGMKLYFIELSKIVVE